MNCHCGHSVELHNKREGCAARVPKPGGGAHSCYLCICSAEEAAEPGRTDCNWVQCNRCGIETTPRDARERGYYFGRDNFVLCDECAEEKAS